MFIVAFTVRWNYFAMNFAGSELQWTSRGAHCCSYTSLESSATSGLEFPRNITGILDLQVAYDDNADHVIDTYFCVLGFYIAVDSTGTSTSISTRQHHSRCTAPKHQLSTVDIGSATGMVTRADSVWDT